MHNSRPRRLAQQLCRTTTRLANWAAAHHRAALGHLLRGACYGTGTGLVSLTVYWIQHRA
ncbi:hypothetical protein [Streptomyces roseoverticillatus]|uniref:hypothetical protein n=1 Tax=Streptomyces roseoverticillatus TaxID=66429 RepID=UPI000A5831C0|nr:hypothetical protein [Streptomyces roseoverticillatus]